ncbi:MAG: hypothetical protein QY302_08935 [Anaerolineales bacterium]|nr:MAG: hypothetical protein QY302_08935 [Anaerolineales bacterium]
MSNETTQVIYSMNRVGRIVPPNKQILGDISIDFYLDAKTLALHQTQSGARVGVLGLTGADRTR